MSSHHPGSDDAFRYNKVWNAVARLEAVDTVRAAINTSTGLMAVSEAVAEVVGDLFAANACSISLLDDRGYRDLVSVGELAPGEERFPDEYFYPVEQFPLSTQLLLDGTGYLGTSASSPLYAEFQGMWPQMPEGNFLGVPIIAAGSVRGELYLARADGTPPFTSEDLDMARDLATQFGLVLPVLLRQTR